MEIKIKDGKKNGTPDAAEPTASAADAAEEPAAETAETPPAPAVELTEEEKTYREQLLRMAADFDNYRKRTLKEKGETFDRGVASLAEAMLPVLDNLALALDHARKAEGGGALCRGLEMVQKMFEAALDQQGIRPIEAVGQAFDPRLHEVVVAEPTADAPPETVLGELQRGYRHKDRLLRPAKVRIAVAPPKDGGDPAADGGSR